MERTEGVVTLTDEEIETRPIGGVARPLSDTGDDSGDTSDTGDDSGDTSDSSDTGDDSSSLA